MSPKVFSVTTVSIALRRLHDRHRERVDERVIEGDLRVVARAHLGDDVPPEPRGVHDVDLVDRGQPPAALGRDLESPACDPLDLGPRVLARVVPRAVLADALLAEVEPADELPHDHDVDSGAARRAEVRVDAELLAQAEQPLLRTHRLALELGQADGGEQHRVGRAAGGERLVRERRALSENRVAAERVLGVADPERVEHPHGLRRDLGPDPVARQDGDVGHRAPFLVTICHKDPCRADRFAHVRCEAGACNELSQGIGALGDRGVAGSRGVASVMRRAAWEAS